MTHPTVCLRARLGSALVLGLIAGCATAEPPTTAELYRRVALSAVVVRADSNTGSGTVVASEPGVLLVLTAHHVVAAAPNMLRVLLADPAVSGEGEAQARVIASDEDHDLALLVVRTNIARPPLPVAEGEPALYEALYSVAAPMGLGGTAAPALLTSKSVRRGDVDLWEVTGFVFFGTSGGTIANARGELVAVPVVIATFGPIPVPSVGFCVPLHSIRQFLARAVPELDL